MYKGFEDLVELYWGNQTASACMQGWFGCTSFNIFDATEYQILKQVNEGAYNGSMPHDWAELRTWGLQAPQVKSTGLREFLLN